MELPRHHWCALHPCGRTNDSDLTISHRHTADSTGLRGITSRCRAVHTRHVDDHITSTGEVDLSRVVSSSGDVTLPVRTPSIAGRSRCLSIPPVQLAAYLAEKPTVQEAGPVIVTEPISSSVAPGPGLAAPERIIRIWQLAKIHSTPSYQGCLIGELMFQLHYLLIRLNVHSSCYPIGTASALLRRGHEVPH